MSVRGKEREVVGRAVVGKGEGGASSGLGGESKADGQAWAVAKRSYYFVIIYCLLNIYKL